MGITKVHITKVWGIVLFLLVLAHGSVYSQKNNDSVFYENGKKYCKHIVQKGETIYGIAEKFSIKPGDIVFENPYAIDGIKPGEELKIPVIKVKPSDSAATANVQQKQGNYIYHKVEKRETLYSLAKSYNTTVSILDSLNPEVKTKGLINGQIIRIPNKQDTVKNVVKLNVPDNKANVKETEAYKNLINGRENETIALNGIKDTAKRQSFFPDTAKKLSRYNIALIMPFASWGADTLRLQKLLDETEQIPLTTNISIDFYHGVRLALDSLAKKGFLADLHVYNILPFSDSASSKLDSILKTPEMLKMNLIIGPPFPSHFIKTARFAAIHHIPIVSPLSSESSVLKANPYTSKATPSAFTETEATADFIAAHYTGANIVIVHSRYTGNEEYYDDFKSAIEEKLKAEGSKDSVYSADNTGNMVNVGAKMSRNLVNIVIVPYTGTSFVAKFLNQFANSSYAGKDSVILFGMHNWTNNDALDMSNLDTLQFHFPSNEYVNYHDSATRVFIRKYRSIYLTEPSYFSCQGFDIAYFYGTLLKQFGTGIQDHLGDIKYKGVQTSFDMVKPTPIDGYENKAVYIIEYKNYFQVLVSR